MSATVSLRIVAGAKAAALVITMRKPLRKAERAVLVVVNDEPVLAELHKDAA